MITRRRLVMGSVTGLAVVFARVFPGAELLALESFEVTHTDAEWRKLLTADQYAVLRHEATERPFTQPPLAREAARHVRLRRMRARHLLVGHEIRQRYGMAELLGADRQGHRYDQKTDRLASCKQPCTVGAAAATSVTYMTTARSRPGCAIASTVSRSRRSSRVSPDRRGAVAHVLRTRNRPAFIQPMTARVVDKLPEGDAWIYEVKFDGYRALLIKDGDRVQILSRNDKDLTQTYPTVASAGRRLHAQQAVIDGEIVAVDATGRPSFQALQHRAAHTGHAIAFYAFRST